jgi:hypothetical protein
MPQKNGAGVPASSAGPNRSIPFSSPDNSIGRENSQQIEGFQRSPLFLTAQDYQEASVRLDRLARNYRELKWPEEGALKESITLAAIAESASNRAAFLRKAAQLAVVLADRFEGMAEGERIRA